MSQRWQAVLAQLVLQIKPVPGTGIMGTKLHANLDMVNEHATAHCNAGEGTGPTPEVM